MFTSTMTALRIRDFSPNILKAFKKFVTYVYKCEFLLVTCILLAVLNSLECWFRLVYRFTKYKYDLFYLAIPECVQL